MYNLTTLGKILFSLFDNSILCLLSSVILTHQQSKISLCVWDGHELAHKLKFVTNFGWILVHKATIMVG